MSNISLKEYNEIMLKLPEIGDLYFGEVGEAKDKGEIAIFDTESFNYHLYPKDANEASDNEKAMREKRKEILDAIKGGFRHSSVKLRVVTKAEMNNAVSDKEILIYGNNNGNLKNTGCNIFKYIAAAKKDVLYELNFMRFFISEGNKVNCILRKIQFDRVIDNEVKNIVNRRANRHGVCYPSSRLKTQDRSIKNYKGKSFFYNPEVSFDDEPEVILKDFVDFILICEELEKA